MALINENALKNMNSALEGLNALPSLIKGKEEDSYKPIGFAGAEDIQDGDVEEARANLGKVRQEQEATVKATKEQLNPPKDSGKVKPAKGSGEETQAKQALEKAEQTKKEAIRKAEAALDLVEGKGISNEDYDYYAKQWEQKTVAIATKIKELANKNILEPFFQLFGLDRDKNTIDPTKLDDPAIKEKFVEAIKKGPRVLPDGYRGNEAKYANDLIEFVSTYIDFGLSDIVKKSNDDAAIPFLTKEDIKKGATLAALTPNDPRYHTDFISHEAFITMTYQSIGQSNQK